MDFLMEMAAGAVAFYLAGRLVYGCWPWQRYRTWYCTKGEIQYLRDVQTQHLKQLRGKQ